MTEDTPPTVELAELGPLAVLDDGRDLPVRGDRARLVLALLALHRRSGLSVDALVDHVWPDHDRPATARQSLSNIVSRLRSALGPGAVTTEDGRYRLADEIGSHRQRFLDAITDIEALTEDERWDAALDLADEVERLWRGPAWDGVDDADPVVEDRRFLDMRRLRFAALRAHTLVEADRAAEAVVAYRQLVADDPWNEDHRRGLAQALVATGQRTEAMRSMAEARAVLAEAGMTPGPDLAAVERALLDDGGATDRGTAGAAAPANDDGVDAGTRADGGRPVPAGRGDGDRDGSDRAGGERADEATESDRRLPRYRDVFVGRSTETELLADLLARGGLITLVGPGGVGKTRLAVHGAGATTGFDRTWFVDLTPADEPSRVGAAVAEAAAVAGGPGSAVADDLARHFPGERILVVLDNCEHLIEAVADLTTEILDRCPAVTVLATSREAIAVPGEQSIPIAPLPIAPIPTPTRASAVAPGRSEASTEPGPAVQLLAARARAASPDLDLLDDTLTAERICRLVDGLPLAIELAAGRLRTLSPSELADRLDGRLSLLAARRGRTARHRTLEAVVEWSYDLLSDDERLAFERLSVFVGGFTPEAAEAVVADDDLPGEQVLDLVVRLAERSLLDSRLTSAGGQRFRLLEVLRHFATARHEDRGERAEIGRRHLDWAVERVSSVERALRTPDQDAALAALVDDHDNFRAARDRAQAEGRLLDALRITSSVPLDDILGRRERLLRLLGDAPEAPDLVTAHAIYTLATTEFELGRFNEAAEHCGIAADRYRQLDEQRHEAYAQMMEGMSRWGDRARADQVEELLGSALDSFTVLGDEMGQGYIGFLWASLLVSNDGDLTKAERLAAQARELFDRVGSPFGLAHAHESTAHVAVADGRPDDAGRASALAVDHLHRRGNVSCLAHAIDTAAMVKARSGRPDQAAVLLGAAERLRQEAGTATKPWEAYAAAVAVDLLAAELDADEIARLRRRGHDAPMGEVLAIVDDGVTRA